MVRRMMGMTRADAAVRVALVAALSIGMGSSCSRADATGAIRIETSRAGPDTRLTLVAAPGFKLNARLKPALELPDGSLLRFDSPLLTPDSAYFAGPPSAVLSGRHGRVRGTLRASICDPREAVCRSVIVDL